MGSVRCGGIDALGSSQLPRAALLKVPRQKRSIEVVHAILDAVIVVLEGEGVEEFNTNRVATVAGVSVGSLYQYFANKDALLLGVMERGIIKAEQVMRSSLDSAEQDSPQLSIEAVLNALTLSLAPRRALLREMLASTPLLAETGFLSVVQGRTHDVLREVAERHGLAPSAAGMHVAVHALCFLFIEAMANPPRHIPASAIIATTARLIAGALEEKSSRISGISLNAS